MAPIYFRHDSYRPEQKQLVKDLQKTILEKKIGLFEAPTGLGKTDAAISTAISLAKKDTIFFLTPKTTQHKIALEVITGINKKYDLDFKAVNILGKQKMCSEIPNYSNAQGFYEFCEAKVRSGTCLAYKNFKNRNFDKSIFSENVLDAETIIDYGIFHKVCPYELAIELAKTANLIICDYNYIFSPKVREPFLQRINKNLEDSILIIDEAHNLGERVKSNLSLVMNKRILGEAIKELEKINEGNFLYLSEQLRDVQLMFKQKEQELLVDADLFDNIFKNKFEDFPILEPEHIKKLEKNFKNENIVLPYVYSFFSTWFEKDRSIIRFFKTENEKDYNLYIRFLDPALVTKNLLNNVKSAILMSGTLSPFKMHIDILGLPKDTLFFKYTSPFPVENKLVMYDDSFSTKYELRNTTDLEKISTKIGDIINTVTGNVAVFLPSHKLASEFYTLLSKKTTKKVYLQDKNAQRSKKLVEDFKKSKGLGSILLGVLGGSFSEGLDFPGEELIGIFIIGVPFPEPTLEIKESIKYYDEKFANGWDYAYTLPTFSKVIQAAGRLIRTEKDRGFIALMDQRYLWTKYFNLLPEDLKPRIELSQSLVEKFFNSHL